MREKLTPIFDEAGVLFAYLHGSYARGEEHGSSDLDIAVFSEEGLDLKERASLAAKLSDMTGLEADVASLNNASLSFRHQVVRDGEVIYSGDDRKRHKFEEEVYRRYLDIKPLMKRFNQVRRQA